MTKNAKRITIERTFHAPIEDVWDLWTTKDGVEAWWGPGGFVVEVSKLELRPGGELVYAMVAKGPDQVAFMERAGMPLRTEHRLRFTVVEARARLAFVHMADFIPNVEPYQIATEVELHATDDGVRMRLTFDAMHDDVWTQRATMGREGELEKLARLIDARASSGPRAT